MRALRLVVVALFLAPGCGPGKFVPVSGKVTLNGVALADATVSFQPVAAPGSLEAGPGSYAKTNERGEYTLKTITGKPGAVVGKHQVRISALPPNADQGDLRPAPGAKPPEDKVPARYNTQTTLTFEVPAGGTNKADFALESP
jgi:hypothetical protein